MHPVFMEIFGRPIYWYGVLTAAGFLLAVAHWSWLAARDDRPKGIASELGIWVMVGGIGGARLAYIIANTSHYLAHPMEIIRIDQGGLIFYGGFLGATAGIVLLARLRSQPLWGFGDFVITAVPLGHAVGRVGCFLNGCCYGSPTSLPVAVHLEDAHRHPTQLYETGANLALYAVLVALFLRKRRDGTVVAAYLMLYPVSRFLLEFLRGDDRQRWLSLTMAQNVSIVLFAAGVILWFALPRRDAAHGEG